MKTVKSWAEDHMHQVLAHRESDQGSLQSA